VNTRLPIEELVEIILRRSICRVQMGAVIYDSYGVFAWGWNHPGENGLGQHAEVHAMRRASKRRLVGATLVVAGRYRKSRGLVEAMPCDVCLGMALDKGVSRVVYRGRDGAWRAIRLAGQGDVEKP
jgi:tRNA(Arg) A34 adenosine deaminase TadA